jgi:hypothetical protein
VHTAEEPRKRTQFGESFSGHKMKKKKKKPIPKSVPEATKADLAA